MTLDTLLPRNGLKGTGLIAKIGEHYVFLTSGKKHKTLEHEKFFFGIGGHLEKGENFREAIKREAQEEIGSEIHLLDSDVTFHVNVYKRIKRLNLSDTVHPYIVYEMKNKRYNTIYYVTIFKAEILSEPYINDRNECSAVIGLTKEQIKRYHDKKPLVEKVLLEGGKIFDGELDDKTKLFPIGTPCAFGLLLRRTG
ncbi:MAG: NUDIX hydrolase [Elusimicrobiota bacterium]